MNSYRTLVLVASLMLVLTGCQNRADYIRKNKDYLTTNKKQQGVKVTPSGLQYKVLKAAKKGAKQPVLASVVTVHYEGRFVDGRIFDSSYKRKEPSQFPVTGVIRGWTEALTLMKEGDIWELTIPQDLAYGPSGRGPIPGFSTLVFKVELINTQNPK
jgi:FKBP-type peptidyl-prolyl cis-trans isomerase